MELFRDSNFDFLGKKWPFIIISLVLLLGGIGSILVKGGLEYGIDFKGGALMHVRFAEKPELDNIRSVISSKIPGEISVQEITSGQQEVMIGTELNDDSQLDAIRIAMIQTLEANFGEPGSAKIDFNNVGITALAERLREPLQRSGVALSEDELQTLTRTILNYRDTPPRSGLLTSFDGLSSLSGVTPAVVNVLKQESYLSKFAVRNVEIVGPKVGSELRSKALQATLLALLGMLVYIGFRFEFVYGFAGVLAVTHDILITLGFFSIFNKPIDLTVVAALLTLVGYSMNDKIVVFDRIRENLHLTRREEFPVLVNASINQTLSRTILTSGLTLLTALALWIFGGPVLSGFSFALVVGVIIGTYSSIFIASPILIFWQNFINSRKAAGAPAIAGKKLAK